MIQNHMLQVVGFLAMAREDGVAAAWAIVQPILGGTTSVHTYEPGSWGPAEAMRLTAEVGGWHSPGRGLEEP